MGKETAEHYRLECRKFKEQRKEMIKNIGKGRLNIERPCNVPALKDQWKKTEATGKFCGTRQKIVELARRRTFVDYCYTRRLSGVILRYKKHAHLP
jgi:hypothetical protein